jgi:hypothetical protein
LALREADTSGKQNGLMKDKDAELIAKDRDLVQQVIDSQQAVSPKDLAINGRDLIQMGMQPGPEMGQVLQKLLDAVIENPELNDPQTLEDMASALLMKQGKTAAEPVDNASEMQKYYDTMAQDRKDSIAELEKHLPDYKWSWDGQHLDVWPTKSFGAEDHFERTGEDFRNLAQGRIYLDDDGFIEIHVWDDRGIPNLREQGIEEVDQWCLTNLGESSDIVTYEKEPTQEDKWVDAWKNSNLEIVDDWNRN